MDDPGKTLATVVTVGISMKDLFREVHESADVKWMIVLVFGHPAY